MTEPISDKDLENVRDQVNRGAQLGILEGRIPQIQIEGLVARLDAAEADISTIMGSRQNILDELEAAQAENKRLRAALDCHF